MAGPFKQAFRDAQWCLRHGGLHGFGAAVAGRYAGEPATFNVHTPQLEHPVTLRVPSTDVSTYKQVVKREEYRIELAKRPTTIVDAGANIGLASVYFASRYPNARVLSIEPEAQNFALLQKNTAPYRNIEVVQAALWSESGVIGVVDSGTGAWGFRTETLADATVANSVRAATLDELLDEHGFDQVDLLKIDIEGAEVEVFADTSAWIDRVNVVVAELHERYRTGCLRNFYTGTQGFPVEWSHGESTIVARRDWVSAKQTYGAHRRAA
jgi:FkbM family methyltransferase